MGAREFGREAMRPPSEQVGPRTAAEGGRPAVCESEGPAAVSAVRPQLRAVRKGCGAPGLRSPLCIPATKALELRSNLSAGSDLGPAV